MKHISELLEDVDRLADKYAGKTVEQIDRDKLALFAHEIQNGKFPRNRLFTTGEVAYYCRRYGIGFELFWGRYLPVDHPDVRLTDLENRCIEAWEESRKPTEVRVGKGQNEKWMKVNARLKRVMRYSYIGNTPKSATPDPDLPF